MAILVPIIAYQFFFVIVKLSANKSNKGPNKNTLLVSLSGCIWNEQDSSLLERSARNPTGFNSRPPGALVVSIRDNSAYDLLNLILTQNKTEASFTSRYEMEQERK